MDQARRRGVPKTRVAEQYLEESVRMADHPGIVFRDGAGGRRAALAGHRLDVWQVVETIRQEGGDIDAAADYFGISAGLVGAAAGYYADYRDEIDGLIEENAAMARDAEAAWRRRQEAFRE